MSCYSLFISLYSTKIIFSFLFLFSAYGPFHILCNIGVSCKCTITSSPWQTVGYLLVNVILATLNRFQLIKLLKHSRQLQ